MMRLDPVNPNLVKDSAFFNPIMMASCDHPNLRSFTFTTKETIKLCLDCGYEEGQGCLARVPNGG